MEHIKSREDLIDHFQESLPKNVWLQAPNVRTKKDNSLLGRMVENALGVVENNIQGADIPHIKTEVKTHESGTDGLLTLMAKSPSKTDLLNLHEKNTRSVNRRLLQHYGVPSAEIANRTNFNLTLYRDRPVDPYNAGKVFSLNLEGQKLGIRADGLLVAQWDETALKRHFNAKLSPEGTLALVTAKAKTINGFRHFMFEKLELFWGTDFDRFIGLLADSRMALDTRTKYWFGPNKSGKDTWQFKDRGTAFRIPFENMWNADGTGLYRHYQAIY